MEEEEKKTFWQAQKEVFRSLQKALELDAARVKMLGDKKEDDPTPSKNLKVWWQNYKPIAIMWFIAVIMVIAALQPKQEKRKSHHGINKYGQPY